MSYRLHHGSHCYQAGSESLCLHGLVMYKGFRLNYLRSVQHSAHSNAFCFPITEGILPDASVCTDVNSLNEILQSRGTNSADGKPNTNTNSAEKCMHMFKRFLYLHFQFLKCIILFLFYG